MKDYRWGNVPEELRGGLARYIEHGIPPGGFLRAVLENDMLEACKRADDVNRYRLFDIIYFLYNNVSCQLWGSPEAVEQHISQKALERRGVSIHLTDSAT